MFIHHCTAVLATLAGATVMVLAIVAFVLAPSSGTSGSGSTSTSTSTSNNYTYNVTCDDNRTLDSACIPLDQSTLNLGCTLGYSLPGYGACVTAEAPPGSPCTSVCYIDDAVTLGCDNITGACVGDVTECRGYCTSSDEEDWNTTLPVELFWETVIDFETSAPVFWNYAYDCYWNAIRLFTLDLGWLSEESDISNLGNIVGLRADCRDYLDATFLDERGDCLVISEHLLDPTVTPPEYYLNNTVAPPQFRVCIFLYQCAALNQTAIHDVKRDVDGGGGGGSESVHDIGRRLLHSSAHFNKAKTLTRP
jgi:hypothetical protein